MRVNPTNPDIVYVAALGDPFAPNPDRGVFRSKDGGKTWQKVLYISDTLGAADLEIQPGNPNVIFACMWHGQRKPWTIISGAREGGIYKSTDGGDTWNKLAGGLPNELFGRATWQFRLSKPNRIYALIEAKPGSGLYRSEDAGATWTLVNGQGSIITRPVLLRHARRGSQRFRRGFRGRRKLVPQHRWRQDASAALHAPHGDHHDIWINPKNSQFMIQSNDGGANVSLDGGRTWSSQDNQPTAEIYQVAVDNQYPYRVYGAQQDNTTVIVPSLPLGDGQGFRTGPGCETGPIIPEPVESRGGLRKLQGPVQPLNLTTTDEQQYWVGAQSLYGNAGQRADLPLSARLADGGFAVRSARGLLRLAVSAPHARWRRDVADDQPGPDRASAGERRARAANRSRAMPRAKKCTARCIRFANRPCNGA